MATGIGRVAKAIRPRYNRRMILTFWKQLYLVLVYCFALFWVFCIGSVIGCLAARVKIKRTVIFYGRPIVEFEIRQCPIQIGALPLGAYVTYDHDALIERPLAARCMVACSGSLMLLAAALIALPPGHALEHFFSGFQQILHGAIAPIERGKPLVGAFYAAVAESPLAGFGILAAKSAACNLLPVLPLPGGRLLWEAFPLRRNNQLFQLLALSGCLGMLLMAVGWVVAIGSHFLQRQ